MKEFQYPQKLANLISNSFMETMVRVQVGNSVNSELRQGYSLSSILFHVVLEKVIWETKIRPQEAIKLQDTAVGLLEYTDDIILMEELQDKLKILFSRPYKAVAKVGLQVNEGKTEYLVLSRRELQFSQSIKIDHYEFEKIKQL